MSSSNHEEEDDDETFWEPLQVKPLVEEEERAGFSAEARSFLSTSSEKNLSSNNNMRQSKDKEEQQSQLLPNLEHAFDDASSQPPEVGGKKNQHLHPGGSAITSTTTPAGIPPTSSTEGNDNNNDDNNYDDPIIQQALIHTPVQLFWSRFLVHFACALWQLDLHLRLGLILVGSGASIRFFSLLLWSCRNYYSWMLAILQWSPRLILFVLLILGPWIYLEQKTINGNNNNSSSSSTLPQRIQAWLTKTLAASPFLSSSPEQLWTRLLTHLGPSTIRTLFLLVLLLPTLLEMRTLVFLSHLKAQAGWNVYNTTVALAVFGLQYYLWRRVGLSPRECSQKAVVFLYGTALLISLYSCFIVTHDDDDDDDKHTTTSWRQQLPWLAAPFLTSTGVLLWKLGRSVEANDNLQQNKNDNDILSFVLRQALRQTARDVVKHVGTSVQTDEMLQLALLRWLVDYWTTSSATSTSSSSPSSDNRNSRNNNNTSSPATSASHMAAPQLEWQDVLPMLQVTTDQMTREASTATPAGLQHPTPTAPRTAQPSHENFRSSSHPTPPATAAGTSTAENTKDPFQDLKSMLLNWDIDETAKPAVQTLQRGIAAFPPSRKFVIAFSVARRSPAFLALLYQVAVGQFFSLSALLVLVALVAFELLRLHEWIISCHEASVLVNGNDEGQPESFPDHAEILQTLEPMVILLSEDHHLHGRPASLLRVWWTLCESVTALQAGLTGARYVQATAIAAQFADNVATLAKFGLELHQYGWQHGLMVALREAFVMHYDVEPNNRGPSSGYAQAAYGAYNNSQRLYKHASAFAEEGHGGNILIPLLGLVPVLIGHGWLWAQQQPPPPPTPVSTVVIEEIIEDDESDPHEKETSVATALSNSKDTKEAIETVGPPPVEVSSIEIPTEFEVAAISVAHELDHEQRNEEVLDGQLTAPINVSSSDFSKNPSCAKNITPDQDKVSNTAAADSSQGAANLKLLEDRARLMDLVAKCHINGLLDERDKDRICENLASPRGAVNLEWMEATLRTLEGLWGEYEQNLVVAPAEPMGETPLESSTDDLFSVSLRSSLEGEHNHKAVRTTNLAESDEWEGLGTGSSKTSLESLVAVEETHEVPTMTEQQGQSQSNNRETGTAAPASREDGGDTPKILLSVAAIGAAAFGAFITASSNRPQPPPVSDQERQNTNATDNRNQNHDSDWVQVERRQEEHGET